MSSKRTCWMCNAPSGDCRLCAECYVARYGDRLGTAFAELIARQEAGALIFRLATCFLL